MVNGKYDDLYISMFRKEDLDIIPDVARDYDVVIICIDINKHSTSDIACTLRSIEEKSNKDVRHGFLTFDGFCCDPRELHEIPEVIKWANEFVVGETDVLALLSDERVCQSGFLPPILAYLSEGCMGRGKMCCLAGFGTYHEKEADGGGYIELDERGHAILDSIGVKQGNA